MNITMLGAAKAARALRAMSRVLLAAGVVVLSSSPAYAQVAQSPLYLGGGNVPGNLTLVPSVEWPTINSVANLGEYTESKAYAGYFDSNKCYNYVYNADEIWRFFQPVAWTTDHRCTGPDQWSGNFMNWAVTQTIDPFRKVLTGGYRYFELPYATLLEKARHDGQGGTGIYPNRRLPGSGNSSAVMLGATPFNANWMRTRIQGLGVRMRFRLGNDGVDTNVTAYDPAQPVLTDRAYEVSIRVSVCWPGYLEPNCRPYSGGHKPEGLIQQYSDELRIGVFGYLNDPSMLRDGGVLRARQKFVGPTMIVPGAGEAANPNSEWDPVTGYLKQNPDPADASATTGAIGVSITNSGAINYLNKFGQLTTNNHKNFDPVSELYYTAIRYLKNQGNVPQYTDIPGNTSVNAARAADGFPVITDWDDPVQYACQTNVILGIGDVYTHRDKNLPGSNSTSEEPAKPAAVTGDATVNVMTATAKVAQLEGISLPTPYNNSGNRNNSAFLVGLAWDSHTRDIRPDITGTQTVSTHWVDVLEAQSLEPPTRNQYYLATKYGGFRVPDDFDPDAQTGALDLDWWHSNGETLASFGRGAPAVSFPRPDNYYVAGEANEMVASLTEAFANIAKEVRSSASSVAANSTRLGSDTAVFQAAFDSANWSGDLQAFSIDEDDGTIATTASWSAATKLDALTDFGMATRKIFTVTPPAGPASGPLISTTGRDFVWTDLVAAQRTKLRNDGSGGQVTAAVGQSRLNYLRGVRALEEPQSGGIFRQRDSRLGDIVNSDPQFVHTQDFGYALLDQSAAFSGDGLGESYIQYRQDMASRPPMVVVGANDGMLHGFDASMTGGTGGNELFAFVPNEAFENLYELTLPEYEHRYFVDASPRVADAYVAGSWRTIVVGTTGAGGRSVFALDVTDPANMTKGDVLWEFTHPALGKTIGQPAVAPLPNGEFGVVITTGYDTGGADGIIGILNPATGAIVHAIALPNSGELGPPLVVDLNSDRVADRIYVGDTLGNVWRVDLVGSNVNNWKPPAGLLAGNTPLPLFVAVDDNNVRQAITAPLSSAFNDKGLHTIFFGTGSYYRVDDNVVPPTPQIDTFYGIIDGGVPTSRGQLLEQEILAEVNASGIRVRGVTDNEILSSHKGWYLDLVWPAVYGGPGPVGERVVSRASVRGDRVIFATLIPDPDPCEGGGDSWIMELNTFDGGRLDYAVFDLNNDGKFDEDDWITITDENGIEIKVPASGIAPDIDIVKTPAIISGVGDNNDEVKILSGSSGQLIRISERGGIGIGRQSWRQLR